MKRFYSILLAISFLLAGFSFGRFWPMAKPDGESVKKSLPFAEHLQGLEFEEKEREMMTESLIELWQYYGEIRGVSIPYQVAPAMQFNPLPGDWVAPQKASVKWELPEKTDLPANREELAFYPVAKLSVLLKNKKITSTELTKLYLGRLKKYGDTLLCAVSITEELALKQAKQADEEIKSGKYRGPLHGIPYGVKDLLAVPGYKTTLGSVAYQDQELDHTATVVKKLEEAGAVLVAKLSLGELAMGDVWFGGMTRNPWDLSQGSSGSSAGSASATVSGLVGFSIGSETWGSIVSPSTRCGASGLRPTFGRVSRAGAMALSWSMDKIGPICRTAEDCALVLSIIHGSDGLDLTVRDMPFAYQPVNSLKSLKIGYLKREFEKDYGNKENDKASLEMLQKLGAELVPFDLPEQLPVSALSIILSAEAGAAFDELTRSNRDSLLVRQTANAWPNEFRTSRFIPAVEYLRANRIRSMLMQDLNQRLKGFDVVVCPSFGGNQLLMTNLTGHPCVVIPNGFDDKGHPTSISFFGNLYEEGKLVAVAKLFQQSTDFEDQHPSMFK
jgi:Asp-tRNA(Asn)/Glu-tRNA(Gln) amidotransferase A subunit family amidase